MQPSDSFDRFVDECGLRLSAEPLCAAPRDVLAPREAIEQHFLVSLSRPGTGAAAVRLIFLAPIDPGANPSMRDVLWWVAGDAWVLEQGEGQLKAWAATYGYSAEDEATAWLFEQANRQAAALAEVLGESDMRRLMRLYEAEVGPSRRR